MVTFLICVITILALMEHKLRSVDTITESHSYIRSANVNNTLCSALFLTPHAALLRLAQAEVKLSFMYFLEACDTKSSIVV
jgi:hypothetical protein